MFTAGRVLLLDNCRKPKDFGWPGFSRVNLGKQDKGQNASFAAFFKSVEAVRPAILPDEIFEVARVTNEVANLLR